MIRENKSGFLNLNEFFKLLASIQPSELKSHTLFPKMPFENIEIGVKLKMSIIRFQFSTLSFLLLIMKSKMYNKGEYEIYSFQERLDEL